MSPSEIRKGIAAVIGAILALSLCGCAGSKSAQPNGAPGGGDEGVAVGGDSYKMKDDSDEEAAKFSQHSGLMTIDEKGIERYHPPKLDAEDESVQIAFKDGVISEVEYQTAFRRWSACVEERGGEVVELSAEPETPWLINYSTTEDAFGKNSCYVKFFSSIDNAWQMSHADYDTSATGMRMFLESKSIQPKQHEWQLAAQIHYHGLFDEYNSFASDNYESIRERMRKNNAKMMGG